MGCNRVLCISALFVIFHVFCSCRAFDTITRTHFIADNEKGSLVSSDGNFKLGFFSPGKSQARYVGIWFNKITQQTVVWVANRASPVKDSSGVFKIGGDGNLAVFCCNQSSPVWSTNVSVPAGTSTAKLLDSGNLVLVAEETIWQSFDYPTDTVLPYMKFGWNKKTGLNHMMTSWKSIDDPSPGEFSAGFDPHSIPQFFVYRNSVPLRRSGPWNSRVDTKDYDSYQLYIHNITFVSNEEEAYVTCPPKEGTLLSIVVLETTGVLKRLLWHESQRWVKVDVLFQDLCDEYMRCGLNAICNADTLAHCSCLPGFEQLYLQDRYLKCQETGKEGCGKGDGEGFVRLEGVKLPDARNSKFHSNISLEDCERECLKCCNCTGYANQYVVGMGQGCITWHGELRDMSRYKSGQDFYLRVDAAELAADAKKNAKHFVTKNMLVFMIVPIVIEMMLAALFFYYWWWKKNEKRKGQKQKRLRENSLILESARSLSNQKDSISSSGNDKNIELVLFELSTIAAATNHFSSTNKLGRGGFGTVYKGQLPNGQEIAVKRLAKDSGQGILEFKNEVLLIGKLQHRNLVRLLGYCIEKDEKMLIYEFMLNKSLDHFIFDESRKPLLDWTTRFEIILGIARGILYLHQDSRLRIIHRDLKVSNILLGKDMEPKISDFGIARTFGRDQNQRNTKRVVGTYGYMSPEYALDGLYSIKSDVFSFGVILLEIISGKKNRGYFHTDPYSNLIQYTWELWRDGFALKIVDSSIADSSPLNELQRCIQVGLLCVQDNARDRPSMSTVVFMLSNETILPSPQKSTFAIRNKGSGSSIIEREYSINEVTITTFNAR